MASFLEQDFGSESEGEGFNPAPADESDNEAAANSDADVSIKQDGSEGRGSLAGSDSQPQSPQKRRHGRDTNGYGPNGGDADRDGEDEENNEASVREDDEEDDDDDEEEAVTVITSARLSHWQPANRFVGPATKKITTRPAESILRRGGRSRRR